VSISSDDVIISISDTKSEVGSDGGFSSDMKELEL
jgi:hypothetical protein